MNTKQGFLPIIIIVVVAVIGGGAYLLTSGTDEEAAESDEVMVEDTQMMDDSVEQIETDDVRESMEETQATKPAPEGIFTGQKIVGSDQTPLLEYTKADYEKAMAEGYAVAMFFYAEWCPSCKKEFPIFEEAVSLLDGNELVGFRVNYKDSDATDEEDDVARKYGVGYQHTKVIISNEGEQIAKSQAGWSTDDYLREIEKAL